MKKALATVLALLPVVSLAESAGGLSWTAPSSWTAQPQRPMRAATYQIPPAKGDAEPAELAVFYFGQGQGGGVEQNVQRWYGQFEQPDGKPSASVAKTRKAKVAGLDVTYVELTGTYTASMGPMAPKTNKPGYRLLGAIVEGPQGSVFFKMTGPAKTVEAAKGQFEKVIQGMKKE